MLFDYFNSKIKKMTFAPTKKTSKSRSKRRTSNWIKLSAKKLKNRVVFQYDDKWNSIWLNHFASSKTWMYRWNKIYEIKSKDKRKVSRI